MATKLEDRLNRWEVLNANFKNHLEAMPDMKAKQAEFEQIITQDLALAAQFNQANASARAIIRQRRELARKGNQLRNILVATLKHQFGPSPVDQRDQRSIQGNERQVQRDVRQRTCRSPRRCRPSWRCDRARRGAPRALDCPVARRV